MKYAPQEDNRKYDEEARNLIRALGFEQTIRTVRHCS